MFGLFSKSKSSFDAQISPDGRTVTVKSGDNLLKAALDQGLAWPHNCRVGSCGTCRCRLKSGKIKPLNDFSYVLDKEELDSGMILACQTSLKSDVEIEVKLDLAPVNLTPTKATAGVISGSRNLTHDILEIEIRLDEPLPGYLAGQWADLSIPGVVEKPRSYSFARAPSAGPIDTVAFYIRRVPGGQMTEWLHTQDRTGHRVLIDGPNGSFWLRESEKPMLCVAGGSGLAPIKALLEHLEHDGFKRDVAFIFGARTQKDLYCLDEMARIKQAAQGRFTFLPVLSAEPEDSDWRGLRGMCPDYISNDIIDVASADAYLCGPPPMIDASIERLERQGVTGEHIYFDKFFDASTMPGGR